MADSTLTSKERESILRARDVACSTELEKSKAFENAGEKLRVAQYELELARQVKDHLERKCDELGLLDQPRIALSRD